MSAAVHVAAAPRRPAPRGVLTPREADVFRCFADTVVAPRAPAIRDTDASAFLDDWLAESPALNRHGIRAMLYALEVAPLATGAGARLRRLPAERRRAF